MKQKPQKDLSPPHSRRRKTRLFHLGLFAAAAAFAVLAALSRHSAFFTADLLVTRCLQQANWLPFTLLMRLVSWPGYTPQSWLLAAGISALLFARGLRWEALVSIGGAAALELLNLAVKLIVHRPRPSADLVRVFLELGSYSFPSGHVMFYTGYYGYAGFLAFMLLRPSWKRTLLLALAVTLVLLVGVSRIYLGEHWASDALGAYLLGSLALAGITAFYRWGKQRHLLERHTEK